jgi:hypothetical protein
MPSGVILESENMWVHRSSASANTPASRNSFGLASFELKKMLYKAACLVRANAKVILKKILGSGEADGKVKVMFVKNMVCVSIRCRCPVLIKLQRKYKQITSLMEEEGWVPGVDWIDADTESALEWKEPNGVGEESTGAE